MVIEACTCEEGLGLHHDPHWQMPTGLDKTYRRIDTGEIRLWVNWKAVARALVIDGKGATSGG